MKPEIQTDRFDVFRMTCERNPAIGVPRDVYLAFWREWDIPRPACTCTIWPKSIFDGQPFVEWIEVAEDFRRDGVATEILLAIQNHVGPLVASGTTESGTALCNALAGKLLGKKDDARHFTDEFIAKLKADGLSDEEIVDVEQQHREVMLKLFSSIDPPAGLDRW